jgi:hypothetical protein
MNFRIFLIATTLSIFSLSVSASAQTELKSGIVEKVIKQDITVKYESINRALLLGEKLHINLDTVSVTLEVKFPMQTSATCRLAAKDTGMIEQIQKGQILYYGVAPYKVAKSKQEYDISVFFKDNGDGTITDKRTGLIWLQNANYADRTMIWNEALLYGETVDAAGHTDWRLPSKDEFETFIAGIPVEKDLRSLLEKCGFKNVQTYYWSSTGYTPDSNRAWRANLSDIFVFHDHKLSKSDFVWLVRTER